MAGFNSSSLDNIVDRIEEVIVKMSDGYEKHLTPQEAAKAIAGTAFRKYVEVRRSDCAGDTTTTSALTCSNTRTTATDTSSVGATSRRRRRRDGEGT